jgi:hypothetical protein
MNAPDEPLADLRHHWGSAYNIQHIGELWLAQRLDKSRATVSAKTPGGLLAKIRDDYAAQPVPRQAGPGVDG